MNDLYTGRTVNPNLSTLEALRAPYEVDLSWLLSADAPAKAPRTGRIVFLPPHPLAGIKQRALREVHIPFVAWSMYDVFARLEAQLLAIPATAKRPIVAEASGDALVFRLATFLFQPFLAAEKAGEADVIPGPPGGRAPTQNAERWVARLRVLGDMWKLVLPGAMLSLDRSEAATG